MAKKKYIITDIDGVVPDWEEAFSVWAEQHGHKLVEGYHPNTALVIDMD